MHMNHQHDNNFRPDEEFESHHQFLLLLILNMPQM